MRKENYYSASEWVARRAGCLQTSYRTIDGRYIISEQNVRSAIPFMTPDEYVTGFDIKVISEEEAERLIAEGGYQIGPKKAVETVVDAQDSTGNDGQQSSQGESETAEDETPSSEDETPSSEGDDSPTEDEATEEEDSGAVETEENQENENTEEE